MTQIEHGSTNVYADLGIGDAEEMLVKAQLATKIGEIIKQRKLTKTDAEQLLITCNLAQLVGDVPPVATTATGGLPADKLEQLEQLLIEAYNSKT